MFFLNFIPIAFLSLFHTFAPVAADKNKPAAKKAGSSNELHWHAERKLTWNDFSGPADESDPLHAMTTTNIDVQAQCKSNVFHYEVKSVFVTSESWSKNKESVRLLDHEQQHFNLTEIYARLLRKRLSELENACNLDRAVVGRVVNQVFDEWKKEQDKYDRETNHGLNYAKQDEWAEKIKFQLTDLTVYQ